MGFGVGEMVEGGQKVHTSRYKYIISANVMYNITIADNTILYI